MREDKMFII